MLKCEVCQKQTSKGRPTGTLTVYREKAYEEGYLGRQAVSQKKTCFECSGERMEGNNQTKRRGGKDGARSKTIPRKAEQAYRR